MKEARLLYLSFIDVFETGISVGVQSILSKVVEPDEFGKVATHFETIHNIMKSRIFQAFGCLALTKAGIALISFSSSYIYSATLTWHDGFILCLANLFFIFMAILSVIMFILMRKSQK